MTQGMRWIGFVATTLIVVMLVTVIIREPDRQQAALTRYNATSIARGVDLYALHCAECHGATGEGLDTNPSLNQEFVRDKDYRLLFNTIQRGRYGKQMAAFGINEGGMLTNPQIDSLVMMLQQASWDRVEARVAELDLVPVAKAVTPVGFTASVAEIDNPQVLPQALDLFRATCSECHGENGEGTGKAPQLNTPYVQSMSGEKLVEVITYGVPGTEMQGFGSQLTPEDKAVLVYLLHNWNATQPAAPTVEPFPTADPNENGQALFETWCAICHGVRGEGGAIAPSLNDLPFLPVDFIVNRVRTGKNAMPPFPEADLPDGQLAALMDYALRNIIGSGLPLFSDEEVQQAGELYALRCAECHGQSGEGKDGSGPPIVMSPPLRASQIVYFVRFSCAQIPPDVVSEAELDSIIAYLYSLTPH